MKTIPRRVRRWAVPALGLALILALTPGCGDEGDDPTGPAPATALSGPEAEQWTTEALTMINQMAASVDEWAMADFSGLAGGSAKAAGEEPVWDPDQMAWVLSYEGPFLQLDPPDSWILTLDYWIQFRAGGNPVADPALADAYEARLSTGMTVHGEDQGVVSDLDYVLATEMTVTGLGGETYGVAGTGSSTVEVSQSGPEGSYQASFAMGWEMDLSVPADGSCPVGTARVTAPGFTLDAIYDGAGGVDWTLAGESWTSSGSEILDCGAVAKR